MNGKSSAPRTLDVLAVGESAVVDHFQATPDTISRLMQMGLWPGERVTVFHRAPLGGPLQLELMDYRLALRREDARKIFVQ